MEKTHSVLDYTPISYIPSKIQYFPPSSFFFPHDNKLWSFAVTCHRCLLESNKMKRKQPLLYPLFLTWHFCGKQEEERWHLLVPQQYMCIDFNPFSLIILITMYKNWRGDTPTPWNFSRHMQSCFFQLYWCSNNTSCCNISNIYTCSIIKLAWSSRRSNDLYSMVFKLSRWKAILRYSWYCPLLSRLMAFSRCSIAVSTLSDFSSIRAISIWTWQRNKINMLGSNHNYFQLHTLRYSVKFFSFCNTYIYYN